MSISIYINGKAKLIWAIADKLINSDNVIEYRDVLVKHSIKDLYELFNNCEQYQL